MRRKRAVSAGALSAGVVLAVCGCFLDDVISPDVTGQWELFITVGEEELPYGDLGLVQEGSTVTCPDDPSATITLNNASITIDIAVDVPIYGNIAVVCTGIVSGGSMTGTWSSTVDLGGGVTQDLMGTWRATLVTRALLDVTEFWYVNWSEDGGPSGTATADLTMAPDGTITGTYHPSYGDPVQATGSLYGYDLTLTVVETSPLDRTITLLATVNAAGDFATGRWSGTDGNAGDWDADLSP